MESKINKHFFVEDDVIARNDVKQRESRLAEKIIRTIEKRKDRQNIGTLTRIYSLCKKELTKPTDDEDE